VVNKGQGRLTGKADQQVSVNPTFLLGTQLQYNVYFSSSIYRAVALAPPTATTAAGAAAAQTSSSSSKGGKKGGKPAGSSSGSSGCRDTLYQRLLASVWPQLTAVGDAHLGGTLGVCLVPGDILTVAAAPPAAASAPAARFDFIDTSNVMDYV
jgi:hypothetical protein